MVKKVEKNNRSHPLRKVKKDQQRGAQRALIEDLLQDMNDYRWRIYKLNLVRGIFFGFGSVIGGTVVIALLLWILSELGSLAPFLGDFIQQILDSINNPPQEL